MIVPTSTRSTRAVVCDAGELKSGIRCDEEASRGQGAGDRGQRPGPETAEVRHDQDGRDEGPYTRTASPSTAQMGQRANSMTAGAAPQRLGNQSGASLSSMPTSSGESSLRYR